MNWRLASARNSLLLLVLFCHAPAIIFNTSCVKLPRRAQTALAPTPTRQTSQVTTGESAPLVNINRASREELARLPGIGVGIAARIIAHRERYGAFRRAEHLLMVRGISQRRFEQLRGRVTVE